MSKTIRYKKHLKSHRAVNKRSEISPFKRKILQDGKTLFFTKWFLCSFKYDPVLNLFSFIIHCTWKDEYSQHKTNIGLGQIKN